MWSKEADFGAGAYPYLTKGRLATWDPGGRPPGEEISSPKGLLRQTTRRGGHRRPQTNRETWPCKSQVSQTAPATETTTHLYPSTIVPSHHRGVHPISILRPIERAQRRPGRCRDRGRDVAPRHYLRILCHGKVGKSLYVEHICTVLSKHLREYGWGAKCGFSSSPFPRVFLPVDEYAGYQYQTALASCA